MGADLGTTSQAIEQLLFLLDTNGDNYVSKQEFITGYNRYFDAVRQPIAASKPRHPNAPNMIPCQLSQPFSVPGLGMPRTMIPAMAGTMMPAMAGAMMPANMEFTGMDQFGH